MKYKNFFKTIQDSYPSSTTILLYKFEELVKNHHKLFTNFRSYNLFKIISILAIRFINLPADKLN